jgi:hypothetical protein
MTHAFRALAVLIAIAGAIDPGFAVNQRQPIRVDVPQPSSASAVRLRDRLIEDLGADVAVNTGAVPDAIVLVGEPRDPVTLPAGVPVSVVMSVSPHARNVRLVGAIPPDPVLVGQDATIQARFEATGMQGESSRIVLTQDGVRLDTTVHRWAHDREEFTATLHHVPPVAGLTRLTVAAQPLDDEATEEDNVADLGLLATARTLRVAVYEPRPSWTAAFVRRAIESDPVFVTASLVRPSRGRAVTVGPGLPALSDETLAKYQAVLVGAPEELTSSEAAALATYAKVRGGAVVFLPDRPPSGPYARLVSETGFDEALLDKPVTLIDSGPIAIRASEFALPRRLGPGGVALASLRQQITRAAIVSVPVGRGRIVFSGALDAWRFRADGDLNRTSMQFWTGMIANLAAAAPHRVSVTVRPALAAPGSRLKIHAALDPAAFPSSTGGEAAPAVGASLVGRDGSRHFVRLWPSADTGIFEGETVAPAAGTYDARVSVAGSMADTPVLVVDGVRHPPLYDHRSLRLIAAADGGVVVDAADTAPLARHLRGLARRTEPRVVHPMQSAWWSLPFVGALCAEWAARRRRGAR